MGWWLIDHEGKVRALFPKARCDRDVYIRHMTGEVIGYSVFLKPGEGNPAYGVARTESEAWRKAWERIQAEGLDKNGKE